MDAVPSLVDRGFHPHLHSRMDNVTDLANGTSTGDVSGNDRNMLVAWIALQLAGQVSLPILIATLLFHKRIARRNPTVINLCIVWTLATIPPELLFYTGTWKGAQPSTLLCLFQASTIAAVPPMAAMAYLSVVVHACSVIYEIIHENILRPFVLDLRMILLLSSPYICFFTFALFIAIVGAKFPQDVQRQLFFCEVRRHHLSIPVMTFTVIVVTFTLVFQFWIALMFCRHYLAKRGRKAENRQSTGPRRDVSTMDLQLLIRMIAFTVFELVIVVSSVASIFNPHLCPTQLLLATPPFAVFLIFATSKDVFRAWFPCFFRPEQKAFTRLADPEVTREDDKRGRPPIDTRTPSPESRYSMASVFPPIPAKAKDTWVDRDREVDIEKGNEPPLRIQIPRWPITNIDVDQQTFSTIAVVQGGNPSSPVSPLDTIRALRVPPVARFKSSKGIQL